MADVERDKADARLFRGEALRAARAVMSGNPANAQGAVYLAVFALLAAAALWPDGPPHGDREDSLV